MAGPSGPNIRLSLLGLASAHAKPACRHHLLEPVGADRHIAPPCLWEGLLLPQQNLLFPGHTTISNLPEAGGLANWAVFLPGPVQQEVQPAPWQAKLVISLTWHLPWGPCLRPGGTGLTGRSHRVLFPLQDPVAAASQPPAPGPRRAARLSDSHLGARLAGALLAADRHHDAQAARSKPIIGRVLFLGKKTPSVFCFVLPLNETNPPT